MRSMTNDYQSGATNGLPVSLAQERLWVLEQFTPGYPVYNLSAAWRLTGALNESALHQSLTEILRRHESLRTTFSEDGGQPKASVSAALPFDLPLIDLHDLPAEWREKEIGRLAGEQAGQPFDLAKDRLIRATLVRLDRSEHVLLLTVHQIVADSRSMALLKQELSFLYESFSAGKPSSLPMPEPYTDFSVRQRAWLKSNAARTQLEYWKQRLKGAASLFELPISRPRPAVSSCRAARHKMSFDQATTEALTELARQENCSVSTILLATFEALASRYAGSKDIVIGLPTAYSAPAESRTIGNLSNLLVLRMDLSGEPNFRELLRRVEAAVKEARANAEFPFERLIEELNPPRDQSYHPVVQVTFDFAEEEAPNRPPDTLAISPFQVDCHTTPYDLGISLTQNTQGLEGWIEYATDIFDASTIARLAGHFETMLAGALENPAQRLSHLPLLTDPEQQQVLVQWNDTRIDYPRGECLHQLFEAKVGESPEKVALVFEREELTYDELNRRANRLAHRLKDLGVGPDVLVGIYATRSMEMVVGMLAVLKAGGAYVPLDPAYPADRLAFILQDAQAPVLLTQKALNERLPDHGAKVLFLDQAPDAGSDSSEGNPSSYVKPDNLAYVIYTSGSTGQPKGVAIEHHSPVNFVHWAQQVFTTEELAGVLASTSICFDLSVFELFVPLSAGGKIILAENALQLPNLPAVNQVVLVNTVPSAINQLVRGGTLPPSVRTVNLAGEPLETVLVQQIYQQETVAKVYDLYGPSETTVYSTFALRSKDGPATIGRPISNTQIYLLDEHLQPVAVGVPGELHIGGDGLARGYLNRLELTAQKFIPNPFDKKPGARLYKTGDLARYREDGNIEFLGRKDNQVKIRGFRIELGEVETVLRQHPSLQGAAVVAREDHPGDKRLVAYVVAEGSKNGDEQAEQNLISELRTWLKSKLPDYMVPALFVRLGALPLTPNGKVDRKALPPPEPVRPTLKGSFVGPRNSTEEMLAQIWSEVLRLDKVGIHDNFFELGGHSLMVIQVLSRLRETVQVELSMSDFFERPTIVTMAELVEATLVEEIGELSEEEAESLASSAG